jgi:thiamine-phosphate pyrophosphorylase
MPRPSLAGRHLYLICDAAFDRVEEALRGGVDIVQLRDRTLPDRQLLAHARRLAALTHDHDALFVVNDRVDIALLAHADGVHVGQDDLAPHELRRLCGDTLLIGQSTHSEQQIARAEDVDYLGVGPVLETPTKPGRPSVGHDLLTYAAVHVAVPWFAIGGINLETAPAVIAAGATRLAVVRAIGDADDPQSIARQCRRMLPSRPAEAGAALARREA